MIIKPGVDLGKSFDKLKDAFQRAKQYRHDVEGIAAAYAVLHVNMESFIEEFDDKETIDDLRDVFNPGGLVDG